MELKNEHKFILEQLQRSVAYVKLHQLRCSQSDMYIQQLLQLMDMMASNSIYYTTPLPIDNPSSLVVGILYISEYPICGYAFKCWNIAVEECRCTCHPFYLIEHLSSKTKACSSSICGKVLFDVWLESYKPNSQELN